MKRRNFVKLVALSTLGVLLQPLTGVKMFKYLDKSKDTSLLVGGPRRYERRGFCIHTTMGYNSLNWLQRGSFLAGRPASSDFLLPRNGDIIQISRPGRYAFHTGTATWGGYTNKGQAIHQVLHGVELECAEQDGQRITNAQYIALAALLRECARQHDYDLDAVTTHAIIALPPGRKQDPIFFDGNVFRNEVENPSIEGSFYIFPKVLP